MAAISLVTGKRHLFVTDFSQLRPISITPILARVFESFLAEWVMADIKDQVDPRQFGNMKGSSVRSTGALINRVTMLLSVQ